LRIALGTLLFYAGCLFAYRAELASDSFKGNITPYVLITTGLIIGFWDRLWA